MKRWIHAVLFLVLGLTSSAMGAKGRDMAKEGEIEQQLSRLDPSMLENFRNARIAYDREDFAESARLFALVCERVPKFDPALRRLGASLVHQGKRREGLACCEQAVAINRSNANLVTLASTLAFPKNGEATRAEQERALALALECQKLPEGQEEDVLALTAQLGFRLEKMGPAREATAALERRFPDSLATHYCAAVVAAVDAHWIKAEKEILLAQKAGLSAETTKHFLDSGVRSHATNWRMAGGIGITVALWAVGLVLLFGFGFLLSKLTLRQAAAADVSVPSSPGEQRLRRIYRSLLNVAGVYYYISLPVVLVLVIGIFVAIFYAFLLIGHIPIKLVLILGIGALVTIWTMGKSLFLRVNPTDPGRPLDRHEAEGLWRLTDDVAQAMNTRPIDEIRITEGTDLAVYERGSWREKMENRAKRILILGTAVLDGFKQDDFRSVLAHEYGHFSNRDTAGGDIAMRVQNDMLKFYYTMLEAGQATWLNVAFHFLRLYNFIFRRISHGATRLQEILADRVAAQAYGPLAFEGGLRHVIRQGIAFHARANREIEDAIKTRRPLQNLYEAAPSDHLSQQQEFEEAINRPTTEDDTHPGPMDRFRMISKIPAPDRPAVSGQVWDLFADRNAIVREMMEKLEKHVAPHRA
ncbi:MAG TPA: M48 family metalloprotease [Opitutaceae bacterium]|nr:M48 family metalloprotease [Opitutaceae bacterium]